MNPLRTLAWRVMDRQAPAGTTHVLRYAAPDDCWELQSLRGPYPDVLDASTDLSEGEAAAFVTDILGYPVTLARSSEWVTEPVYYVIPR